MTYSIFLHFFCVYFHFDIIATDISVLWCNGKSFRYPLWEPLYKHIYDSSSVMFYRLRIFFISCLSSHFFILLLTNRFHNTFPTVCGVFCKILSNRLNTLLSAKEIFPSFFLSIANLHQSVLCTYAFLLRIFFLTELIPTLMYASLSFLLIYNILFFFHFFLVFLSLLNYFTLSVSIQFFPCHYLDFSFRLYSFFFTVSFYLNRFSLYMFSYCWLKQIFRRLFSF